MDWWNLMKQSVTVGAQLLWSGRYGCNNGRYGCNIVMSYIEINKAVSQWLLTFNLCVSVTWPLTCAFHIPCTHTPEIIDMHRGMCDNYWTFVWGIYRSPMDSPHRWSVMWSYDVFLSVGLNKLLVIQSSFRRCEILWCPCIVPVMGTVKW